MEKIDENGMYDGYLGWFLTMFFRVTLNYVREGFVDHNLVWSRLEDFLDNLIESQMIGRTRLNI